MKRVTVRTQWGAVRDYATNEDGSGLFERGPDSAGYQQTQGNGQAQFRNLTQMVGWLKRNRVIASDEDVLETFGWGA